jgi:long-subunit acyl-CoA synthetase (AMP-forming)
MSTTLPVSITTERPLAAMLHDHAESRPHVAAVFLPSEAAVREISWREIADDVMRMAALLGRRGVKLGDRIVLWSDNRYEWIVRTWRCSWGPVNVPLHGSLPAPARRLRLRIPSRGWLIARQAGRGSTRHSPELFRSPAN